MSLRGKRTSFRLSPVIIVRVNPRVRRDLLLLRELNHAYRRRVTRCPARPAFQCGLKFPNRRVARTPDRIERDAGPGLTTMAHDLKPSVAAVETLRDGRRWLRGSTETFHLFRPKQAFGGIGFACRLSCALPREFRADPRAPYPITKNAPSRWAAHAAITAPLVAAGNATRI
jgi:hypothetical protein